MSSRRLMPTFVFGGRRAPSYQRALGPVLLALTALVPVMLPASAQAADFRVGAAKVDSTPELPVCTGGYGIFCNREPASVRINSRGGQDRLFTRAMVVESGGEKIAIVTTSAIGLFAAYKNQTNAQGLLDRPGLYETRRRIGLALGMPLEHVFIQPDHSHYAADTIGIWGGATDAAQFTRNLQRLASDMVRAAQQAAQRLAPAELHVASVHGDRLSCPEARTPKCVVSSLYNYDPNLWVDNEFRVLEARRPDGARIVTLANYSTHATVLNGIGEDVTISPDWTGWFAATEDEPAAPGVCGIGEARPCAVGMATLGTLGRTDFNDSTAHWEQFQQEGRPDALARNLAREENARRRLEYFMDLARGQAQDPCQAGGADCVSPFVPVRGSGVDAAERFIHELVTLPVFYANHAPFVGLPAEVSGAFGGTGSELTDSYASIERATTPPWLDGNVIGTPVSSFRIGDLLFVTAPGEEFPNSMRDLREEGGVRGYQTLFYLGVTNDFIGYMGPLEGYDHVTASGALFLGGCPEDFANDPLREATQPLSEAAIYNTGRLFDNTCPDHFVLMASPTVGDHVTCSIQDAAAEIGFATSAAHPYCAALTATDNVGAPVQAASGVPEASGQDGLAGLVTRAAADTQAIAAAIASGDPEAIAAAVNSAANNLLDNAEGTALSDDEASVATTVDNALDNLGQADPGGLAADLQRDAVRVALGYETDSAVRAGVGVVDMTPDVGYCAGQYCDTTNLFDGLAGGDIDPYLTHTAKHASYGVQSRLTARAIVVEGSNGKRVALLKTDNYLAQDTLIRRVAQILAQAGSSISYEQILHSASHNHSSAYSSTPSWGVWIFEDVFDPRFFEKQARKMAEAILTAEADLAPARMGATTVPHHIYKGNVVRLATATDGTPAGYPLEYGDLGLVVMRFEELTETGPEPLAVWVNFGQHPESLEPHNLHTADFLSALERYVDRELGAPLVFTQGDVGSAENSGNKSQMIADDGSVCGDWPENAPQPARNDCEPGQGVPRVMEHTDFAQYERLVRFLADDVLRGWAQIGAGGPGVQVPLSTDFPVDYRSYWAPGPLSHPYPAVSNCNTQRSVEGDVGVPIVGLPDCGRFGFPGENELTGQAAVVYAKLKSEGVPVPDHYDATAFTGVEENLRIYLQAFRIGEVLLASCACEAQVDLILNLETRTDQLLGNQYNGFDWACLIDEYKDDPRYVEACALQQQYYDPAEFPTAVPGRAEAIADPELMERMRAQIHNDARGWDAPENMLRANSEPEDPAQIWGNFTHEELPPQWGYALPVGLGHAGDYVGYTVSYREFMNRDHYRKALTSYGAHTADYMVSRLVRMAGAMKGGPELAPEPHDALAQVDEIRQRSQATALGAVTAAAYSGWLAALPLDRGPAEALAQPGNIRHFEAAEFRWRGGNTQLDNPYARVQRRVAGAWVDFADMSGEVPTRVEWPDGLPGVIDAYAGNHSWEWTANFEAYSAFPARLGHTPMGEYRFVVDGCINDPQADPAGNASGRVSAIVGTALPLGGLDCPGGSQPYHLESASFFVEPRADGVLPRSYADSAFPFIEDKPDTADRDDRLCETCSFRPWATTTLGGVIDGDGDGVLDPADRCPSTGPMEPVDAEGCSADDGDSDGDRVRNADDACPGTPPGAAVDAQGCAESQRDADGDGVSDAADQCPDTQAGTAVDARGCPAASGNLSVSLSADPAQGDVSDGAVTVTFTATASEAIGDVEYVYYFGDGSNSGRTAATQVSHDYAQAGEYTVNVVASDENQNAASASTTVTMTSTVVVDPTPVVVQADLQLDASGTVAPVTVSLDASGSTAPADAIYRFDFGDGDVQEGRNAFALRVYSLPGSYTVTLTVTDPADASNSDTVSESFEVVSTQQTTARLQVSPSRVAVGEPVQLDARGSLAAPGAQITVFVFDFGDGTPPVERSVAEFGADAGLTSHSYAQAGEYTPSVTVSDDAGGQKRAQGALQVQPAAGGNPGNPGNGPGQGGNGGGNGGGGSGSAGLALLALLALLGLRPRFRHSGTSMLPNLKSAIAQNLRWEPSPISRLSPRPGPRLSPLLGFSRGRSRAAVRAGRGRGFAGSRAQRIAQGLLLLAVALLLLAPAASRAQSPQDLEQAVEAALRGCDVLDPASCLYPFPSNVYTQELAVPEAGPARNIYTGRRVDLSALAMPRNVAGKPIDPTEWNRNDGFSPGTMIFTYVPGLDRAGLLRSHGFVPAGDPDLDNRVGITNPGLSLQPDAPIQVLNARTGERHPVWAEMDVNAGYLLPAFEGSPEVPRVNPRSALILRPARNFTPGERYVVVLRDLLDGQGGSLDAQGVFRLCRDRVGSDLPPISARCDDLEADVFPVIANAQLPRDSLYLAWDFTVASAQNLTARLTAMRDDAFASLRADSAPAEADCSRYDYAAEPANLSAQPAPTVGGCGAPSFTVDSIRERADGEVLQIEGTLELPSYLIQPDPSPLEAAEVQSLLDTLREQPGLGQVVEALPLFEAQPFNLLPPNRLNYDPSDGGVPAADPAALNLLPYGDGLPDRLAGQGRMTTRYLCQVRADTARGERAAARATLYGHGLLQSRAAVDYDEGRKMVRHNNFLMCGLDWFGFSQGDLHNVAISLLDMSNWPNIPDASLQGMLNFMFMARLMQHPAGLASHPAFQLPDGEGAPSGVPFFDRSEIYYYGNSQGGILPGPVVAVSKDVNKGVFGVPGMNYSTLLRRSTDFTLYSVPLYLAYQDELERNLLFALIQMLWDRGENNAYAAYLTAPEQAIYGGLPGHANLDGEHNDVLLHPAFSDHQVTYWTADVMARTMGAVSDRRMLLESPWCLQEGGNRCDPDVEPNFQLPEPSYVNGRAPAGPAEVIWLRPEVFAPPIVELPPSSAEHGPDPHGYPRNHATALCQKSHWLRPDNFLADVRPLWLRADGSDRRGDIDGLAIDCAQSFGPPPQTAVKAAFGAPDADGDGIADAFDSCPSTGPGQSVDGQGCVAADADNDGIGDADDACPGTPPGEAVDAQGCAESQRDADGDGVGDAADQCPDTQAGTAVDARGCPAASGNLSVSLSADPAQGDVSDGAVTVTFTATASEAIGDVEYVYYFGDGSNSGRTAATQVSHDYAQAGEYTVNVVASDENQNAASASTTVTMTSTVVVDPTPVVVQADLQLDASGTVAPVTVSLDASGSTAPADAIYRFDFGDGDVQEGRNAFALRVYSLPGSYTVTLTVTDPADASNSDTVSESFEVVSTQQTTARLQVSPSRVAVGEPVQLDARGSLAAPGAQITVFVFDFGDGTPPVERSVAEFGADAGLTSHSYAQAGEYTPSVTVSDDAGGQKRAQGALQVQPAAGGNPGNPGQVGGSSGSGATAPALLLLLAMLGLSRRRGGRG